MKKTLFTGIAMLIPVLFFALLEAVLRVCGFGGEVPLMIDNPTHSAYMLPRPDIQKRYFYGENRPRINLEANFFLKQKPKNGMRIVVQGGSTAAGFPYGLGASLASMLESRLRPSMPDSTVEVINTAMSAVNSYYLLDIAEDIINAQPDLVVIYAGHNEYLGVLGVGSTFSIGGSSLTSAYLSLKNFAVFQALSQLTSSHLSSTNVKIETKHSSQGARTFMSQVASEKSIAFGSALFNSGIQQYRNNMRALLTKYQDAGIPVIIATVASNEKDQAPFVSPPPTLDEQLLRHLSGEDIEKLAHKVKASANARDHFLIAGALYQAGNVKAAKYFYVKARDLDMLRFRAPSQINREIAELSKQYDNVWLADVASQFERRSKGGIIGASLMLEHLHPNLPGYFVIADTVYNTIYEHKEEVLALRSFTHVSTEDAWQLRPILASEEYYGFAHIVSLTSDYPFVSTPKPVVLPAPSTWQQSLGKRYFEKQINWLQMCEQALAQYQRNANPNMVTKTLMLLADALPHHGLYNLQAAEKLTQAGRHAEAAHYERRAKIAGHVSNVSIN